MHLSDKEVKEKSDQAAMVMIGFLELGASSLAGEEARMNKAERMMIEEPLANILARMEPAAVEAISQWTDPLALAIGLFGWLSRVAKLYREKRLAEEAAKPKPPQPIDMRLVKVDGQEAKPGEPGIPPAYPGPGNGQLKTVPMTPETMRQVLPGGGGDV